MAWIAYTTERGLVNETCDLQVLTKNKNYTCDFTFEYETNGSGSWIGNVRVKIIIMSGVTVIDDTIPKAVVNGVNDIGINGNYPLESAMVSLLRDYLKV